MRNADGPRRFLHRPQPRPRTEHRFPPPRVWQQHICPRRGHRGREPVRRRQHERNRMQLRKRELHPVRIPHLARMPAVCD